MREASAGSAGSISRAFLVLIFSFLFFACAFEAAAQAIDAEEQAMVNLINEYRAQNGLSQLKVSVVLTRSAEWMSADMIANNYFGHVDSLGRDPFARMSAFGYNYNTYRGENLAAGYDDAVRTIAQWKNSQTHNAVMLNPNFNVIGISRQFGAASRYRWYWTTDYGGFIDQTFDGMKTVRTVNAASYSQTVAPDALAASFGTQLSGTTASAPATPLPTTLGGISVSVNNVSAPLLFVSPGQINYLVPSSVGTGTATVTVKSGSTVVASGQVNVDYISPSIFTASSSGSGTAAALTTFDGATFQPVANPDGTARPVSVGTAAKPNFLVLYGTGLRRRSSLSGVQVTIGGIAAQVTFAGAHAVFGGLDQLNVRIPLELRGRGLLDVNVVVDGRAANTVKINIGV